MFRTCTELRREPLHKMVSSLLACYFVRGCSLQSLSEFQSPTAHSIVRSIIRFFPRVLHYQLRKALVCPTLENFLGGLFSTCLCVSCHILLLGEFTNHLISIYQFSWLLTLRQNLSMPSSYFFLEILHQAWTGYSILCLNLLMPWPNG